MMVPLVLISGYGGIVNPEVTVLPAVMAMTFPLWVILEVVLLTVTLFVSRRMALLPGITLILSGCAIWDICPLNIPHGELTPEERRRSFTVMSYNVFAFHDQQDTIMPWGNRTASNIINSGADVVCVVEAYAVAPNPRTGVTWAQSDSVACIYPYSIRDEAGVSMYSKYPLRKIETEQAPGTYTYWLAGLADIGGREVLVIAVHLESLGLSQEERDVYSDLAGGSGGTDNMQTYRVIASKLRDSVIKRAGDARKLRDVIGSLGYSNVIVAGDFNDIPGCYAMRRLMDEGLHDAYRTAGLGPMTTYNSQRFYFNIDHILYRGDFKAVDYRRGDVPSSDHYPVFATFLFDRQ